MRASLTRLILAACLTLGLSVPALAQTSVALSGRTVRDTISANPDSATLTLRVGESMGSAKLQLLDSYSGTVEVQCSLDGITFDTGNEPLLVLLGQTGTASSITDTTGIWTISDVAGCRALRVISTAGFAASDTVAILSFLPSGGGSGSGGSGGGEVTNGGTFVVQENGAALAELQSIDASLAELLTRLAQDATHDAAASTTGPQIMGACDDSSTDAVDEGDAGSIRINCATRAMFTQFVGCTPGGFISAGSVNETAIKASAGRLVGLSVTSLDATPVYVKLYNDTTANIDETDTPVWRWMQPANATAAQGTAAINLIPAGGMVFSTAITLRATTGIADNDTGALTASEVLVSYCYE